MATKQAKHEMIILANDPDALRPPAPLALRLGAAVNKAQRRLVEEADNRELAMTGQTALGQRAQAAVGRLARAAGTEFHRTALHHAALLAESQDTSFFACEQEFLRMNLEQEAQNLFALTDGVAQNLHKQVSDPLYTPNPRRGWWS